ncbi:MAG: tRNA-dihydrouridine synthase family protein [Ardenticatenaceae bacterium]|nr:tRNA-dihydrouridine synthase family protein [Anaerolineales bacterium]MCB8920119.1 tRNA-dihydrouridine synthase family protein [Ardenticatenaceae bacterium]
MSYKAASGQVASMQVGNPANLPLFHVGSVPVYGDTVLAPMTGYSDVPYRALCRAYGSAMNYTEFVPVETLLGKRSRNRFWMRLDKKPDEHPIIFQIFGNDAQRLLQAAQTILDLEPDIIDVNMGCSTRKVSGRGAGVGMMPQPELVAQTFSLLTKYLPVPVTGKIRLGWDADQRNFLQIGQIMVENGAALIAMHGRTKTQKYGGKADWDAIAQLKQAVPVPVIGNGDVQAPADIDRMKTHTGCDAVMIGRAAVGNPWIFARRDKADLTFADVATAVRLHLGEMVAYYGDWQGLVTFRKHFKQYMSGYAMPEKQLACLLRTEDVDEFLQVLAEMEASTALATGQ